MRPVRKKVNQGFTFLELMVTAFIVIVACLALLEVYGHSINLVLQAREIAIATDDLKDVMEALSNTAFSNLPIDFPSGVLSNPAAKIGALLLSNEQIQLSYFDLGGNPVVINPLNIPDPLLIEVCVSWTSRAGRNYNQVLRTVRTRVI
ncbi:MAG: hypothetical protein WC321_06965 [Candidatus Omnitrophota bacterium]